jgi:hypothetical protein
MVVQGLGPPTGVYGDHAISEVLLEGVWHKVDSYTVDAPLYAAAQARLAAEGGVMGWGVHKEGVNDWDGRSDSFVQYIMPTGEFPFNECDDMHEPCITHVSWYSAW